MDEENMYWKGSSSQWLNLGPFALAGFLAILICVAAVVLAFPPLFAALAAPLAIVVWKYLVVRCRVFELTNERLRITSGVINQEMDEIELYRVKDTMILRPWWMRVTGLASISLQTSDRTLPTLVIPAIRGGREVREALRRKVETQRDKKRVREMDFDDTGDGEFMG
jgi:membrane protein YdbS with pleckstrin-like domain